MLAVFCVQGLEVVAFWGRWMVRFRKCVLYIGVLLGRLAAAPFVVALNLQQETLMCPKETHSTTHTIWALVLGWGPFGSMITSGRKLLGCWGPCTSLIHGSRFRFGSFSVPVRRRPRVILGFNTRTRKGYPRSMWKGTQSPRRKTLNSRIFTLRVHVPK